MMAVALISWWYGAGWRQLATRIQGRVASAARFFSVVLLLKTLFDPFRQIDASGVRGPIQAQLRAFFDRTFSRFVGFLVRSCVIFFGLTVMCLIATVGIVQLLLWPFIPLLPLIGISAFLIGVGV